MFSFLQPSWISVDFDNWRDWENEEDEGKEEYDRYVDVSTCIVNYSDNVHVLKILHILWYFAIFLQYSHYSSEGLDLFVCVC